MCKTESNDQSQQHAAHCHVDHSSNTVPVFSCPSQSAPATTDVVHSDERHVNASECPYEKMRYNTTTFAVHMIDSVTRVTCTVRYTSIRNFSVIYYEEPFVAFRESHTTHDTGHCDSFLSRIVVSNEMIIVIKLHYLLAIICIM